MLILDKDEKAPDRPASGTKKVYRKTSDNQRRKPDGPSAGRRSSGEFPPNRERRRRSDGAGRGRETTRPSYGRDRDTREPAAEKKIVYRKNRDEFKENQEDRAPERRRQAGRAPFRESGGAEGYRQGKGTRRNDRAAGTGKNGFRSRFRDNDTKRPVGDKKYTGKNQPDPDLIRLNRFIANAGICSRREADELIRAGAIRVNGKIVTELGVKVSRTDKVQYGDQTLRAEPMVYVLLNKPKGYITTVDDPDDRKTVMMLVKDASRYRIYPVGRLDRNTTGLLLFTNDGELAKKLTHPRYRIDKLYHVELDKNLSKNDLLSIAGGVELEDGFVKVDEIAWVAGADSKKEVGIRLHSGKNHIVRRIFEKLGYDVVKLDRVIFAGLTKKDLPRGHWRHLSKEEVGRLKRLRDI